MTIARTPTPPAELSLIVPMYNEEDSCDLFFEAVIPIVEPLVSSLEIICVNDGSTDETFEKLRVWRSKDPRIKIVNLSRNFGKEAAMTAGLDLSTGSAVIPIDADLQDPPELIEEMVAHWREGAQVVLARRVDRSSDSFLKRFTSGWFYRIFSKMAKPAIPQNVGDFRLMDRLVVEALKQLPERSRFMKGLFAWVGFNQVTLDYKRPKRAAGETSFNWTRLWNFALDGIVSFSTVPLKIWSYCGVVISFIAFCYLSFLIVQTLITGVDVPGYASTMSVMLMFNGIILVSLGAIGEYISRIFVEVKQRPLYLINEIEGFEARSIEPINSDYQAQELNKSAAFPPNNRTC